MIGPLTPLMTGRRNPRYLHIVIILTGLVMVGLFAILVLTQPIMQDEGVFLTIGKYLNQGQLPYRDFFDHKPPGMYFLFASLFKVFGQSLWVAKISLILSTVGSAVLLGKISHALKPGSGWLAAILFFFLLTQFEGHLMIAEPFLLTPLLLSLWLLLHPKKPAWIFLAGVSAGLALLFKQTAVLSVLPLLIFAFRSTRKNGLIFFSGATFPWIIFGLYLTIQGLVPEFWHQAVTLTLTSYPRESLSFVVSFLQNNFFWTLPVWILALVSLWIRWPKKQMFWLLILLPLPVMFFRHYPHYWVQLLPFVAGVAAIVLLELRRRALILALLVFCLAIAGGKVAQDAPTNWQLLHEQLRAADVLRRQPVDLLLAENQFTVFYFLLPQQSLNKFLYLTEITDTLAAEQQTIDDLGRGQTVMILWPQDINYAYTKKLQDFILEHSTVVEIFPALGMVVYARL